ncbi:kinetochore-associated Ndc80 complex subunit spc24 [Linnemannia hyalina]|uniref:Kinetochore protein Spc24 n=1 Tax=Linnemannia hyalina TaxID=64524 RepID=A0A9P7Y4T4_9FUNG|nr:kinetochore-associated Ndc80 complex subunit spc24 [Linnemannia hyalina]
MAAADDNIVTLIQEVASQFQRSGADLQNIQKTTHDMREAENNRNEMMHDARTLLQKMSRNLQLSRSKGSRQHVDPDSLRHDDRMMEMDQQKFSIAKAIQDIDQDITSLEAEIHQLRMQSLELDSSYTSSSGGASSGSSAATAGASKSSGSSGGEGDGDMGDGDAGTNGASVRGRGGRNGGIDKDEVMLNDEEDILDDTAHAMAVLRLQLYRGIGIEMLENELGVYSKARIRSSSKNDVHLVKFDDQLSPYFQTNLIWEFAS